VLAALHADTPTVTRLDALGRVFRTIEDNDTGTVILDVRVSRAAWPDPPAQRPGGSFSTESPQGIEIRIREYP
jgi:hypothetical protein